MVTTTFDGATNGIRKQIKDVAQSLKELKESKANAERNSTEDFGEVMANL